MQIDEPQKPNCDFVTDIKYGVVYNNNTIYSALVGTHH